MGSMGTMSAAANFLLNFIFTAVPVLFASACMYVAYNRHRNPGWFFALGFFLGPIGLIIAGLMKDKEE